MLARAAICIERFKLDPVLDPLRKDPRFQALVKDNEAPGKKKTAP